MSVKTAWRNILESGTVTIEQNTADADFPLYRLYDRDIARLFKAASAATTEIRVDQGTELITNGGFETGDFTGWTQGSALIEGTTVYKGSYGAKIEPSGSNRNGPTQYVNVDATKIYRFRVAFNITSYTAGNYDIRIAFRDAGGGYVGSAITNPQTAATAGWEEITFTFGPPGSGADYEMPANAVDFRLRQETWNTPTLTAYMDAVQLHLVSDVHDVDRLIVPSGHNLDGMTLDLQYSDDEVAWTNATSQWTGDAGQWTKAWTAETRRYWRLLITSPGSAPEIPELFLTETYTWARDPGRPSGEIEKVRNVETLISASGAHRALVHGSARVQRPYTVPRCPEAQKAAMLSLWNGAPALGKPFWLYDHTGAWVYGRLRAPLDLVEKAYQSYGYAFEFEEIAAS